MLNPAIFSSAIPSLATPLQKNKKPCNTSRIKEPGSTLARTHGDEQRVWGDAGYVGIDKRPEHQDRDVEWLIAMRPGKRAALSKKSDLAKAEKIKASVRAKVEHALHYIKRMFGYSKVRYRGLAKNTNRLHVLAALANLLRARPYLTP